MCTLLCVDFCVGYCSFRVNYPVGLEKACLMRVNRWLRQIGNEKISCRTQQCNFLKRPSTDFDKNYIFGIGTSSAIEWYLSFLLSISWPSDEPCPHASLLPSSPEAFYSMKIYLYSPRALADDVREGKQITKGSRAAQYADCTWSEDDREQTTLKRSLVKGTNPALKKPSNIPEIYAKMFGRFY